MRFLESIDTFTKSVKAQGADQKGRVKLSKHISHLP